MKLGAVAAVVALVVAVVYFRQPEPSPPPRGAPAGVSPAAPSVALEGPKPSTPAAGPGPATVVAGIPMGYSRDRAGAKAAAAAYVRALGVLVSMDAPAAAAAQRTMASQGAAESLVADTLAKLAMLHERWPPRTVAYRVAPLAVRVVEEGAGLVRAEVWYVGVFSAPDLPTYEEWVTEDYRLLWERDDWRVAAHTSRPGPRPDPGRQRGATAAEIEARLVGFEPT